MFLYVLMALYAGIGWAFNARLGVDDGHGDRADRGHLHFHLARNRCALGQTCVGSLLGLGRAA